MTFNIKEISSIIEAQDVCMAQSCDDKILFLCDIDNTVLRMPQYVGSDEWYRKQVDLIKQDAPFTQGRVAVDLDHLKDLLDKLYESLEPIPLEGDHSKSVIHKILSIDNCETYFVTARNPTAKSSTIRHLCSTLELTCDQISDRLILCGGRSKSESVVRCLPSYKHFNKIIFVDDCFKNISDMAMKLPLSKDQEMQLLYFPSKVNFHTADV